MRATYWITRNKKPKTDKSAIDKQQICIIDIVLVERSFIGVFNLPQIKCKSFFIWMPDENERRCQSISPLFIVRNVSTRRIIWLNQWYRHWYGTHTQHNILTHLNTGLSTPAWMERKKNPLHNSLLSFIRLLGCSVIAYLIQLNSMNNYLFKFGIWWHIQCMNRENIRQTQFWSKGKHLPLKRVQVVLNV